jgi:uncharacterized delta-60 repeat protein
LVLGGCLLAAPADAREGDYDPAFGDVGRVGPIASVPGTAWSIDAMEDGSLVIGGGEVARSCPADIIGCDAPRYVGFAARSFLIRVSDAGLLLESHEIPASGFHLLAIARQINGKFLGAGRRLYEGSLRSEFVVYRLNQDGSLDTGFGDNGLVQLPAAERSRVDQATAIVVEPDGRIVVAGSTVRSGHRSEILIRLLPNGAIDPTFGASGVVVLPGRFSTAAVRIPLNLTQLVRTDAGHYRVSDSGSCQVVGLTPDGTLDPAFGSSGIAQVDHPISLACSMMLAMQADGRLVVGASDGEAAVVTRILADGQPDPSFLAGTGIKDRVGYIIHALAVGPDGSIVVALGLSDFGYHGLEVKQLLPSGKVNESFGNAGSAEIQMPSDISGWLLFDLLVRENGTIVGAGGSFATSHGPIIVQLLGAGGGDGPGVLSVTGQLLSSDEQDVSVEVSRTGGAAGHASVAYQVLAYDGESAATAGEDFVADAGRLEWGDDDSTNRQIRVRIIDDDLAEDDERITVMLSDAEGGVGLGRAGRIVTIQANDGFVPPDSGVLGVLRSSASVAEGSQEALVTVSRTGGDTGTVSIGFQTEASGRTPATAGQDYTEVANRLTWGDGDAANKTIRVPIHNDDSPEGNETFVVRLLDPSGATLGSNATATVTIVDDDDSIPDPPPTIPPPVSQPPATPPPASQPPTTSPPVSQPSRSGGGGLDVFSLLLGLVGLLQARAKGRPLRGDASRGAQRDRQECGAGEWRR